VRLTDAGDVRTYDVSSDGVILGVTYANVDKPEAVTLTMATTGLDRALPDSDMFSPDRWGVAWCLSGSRLRRPRGERRMDARAIALALP
jgi:hypothetical protein